MDELLKKIFFHIMVSIFLKLGKILKKEQLPAVSRFLGDIFYKIPWKRKYIALENLKKAFEEEYSERQLKGFLKDFYKEIILMIFEICNNVTQRESLLPWVKAYGIEYLDRALEKGRGVIAISGHLGNVPVMLAWFAEQGYPIAVLFKEGEYLPKNFLKNLIKSYNIYPIPFISDKDVPKEIIKALNKNMIVFILADQARRGVYAKFFGKYVLCQRGAFVIARRKNSPVVPIFIVREDDKYSLIIYPDISIDNTDLNKVFFERDITILIERYNELLENLIRKYPDQYYWFHRRFKNMKNH